MNSLIPPRLCFILLLFLGAGILRAHQPGNSNLDLTLNPDGTISGEYHIADVDAESVNLMFEDRARYEGGETATFDVATQGVEALAWMTLTADDEPLAFTTGPRQEVTTENGPHTMIPFQTEPLEGREIGVIFDHFFSFDPQHTVNIALATGDKTKVGLLSLDDPSWRPVSGLFREFVVFTIEGVWHIWIGIDHILFLVALLLPSVLQYRNGRWVPVGNFRVAFYNLLRIVTAFTIAHSVTLTLATLGAVSLPSKWVETTIAISVVLAALNNLYPVVSDRAWLVAFGFGLIHGFGFANVLADLSLPAGTLAVALFSFNIGVEIGQLVIVLFLFPLIFALRSASFYQPVKLRLGSALIALVACGWIIDRVFELEMMPF